MCIYLRNTYQKSTRRMGPKVRRKDGIPPKRTGGTVASAAGLFETSKDNCMVWSITVPRGGPVVPQWQAQRDSLKLRKTIMWSGEVDRWYRGGKCSGTLQNSERQWHGLVNYSALKRTGGTATSRLAACMRSFNSNSSHNGSHPSKCQES